MIEVTFSYLESIFVLTKAGDIQGIAFWAVAYSWLIAWGTLHIYWRVRHWPSVIGRIEQLEVRAFGAAEWVQSEQDYIADSCYLYEVKGVEYSGSRIAPWQLSASHNLRGIVQGQVSAVPVQPDGKVRVYYSPKRPNKSYLVRPGWLSLLIAHLIYIVPTYWYLQRFVF
ncbi:MULTISPECIES: DUF3592 domain-containing protein [Deefgea]|nr:MULTISPECIES: DUF3592 domain-containing protein [Deefgea]